jgi:hypothetical protein
MSDSDGNGRPLGDSSGAEDPDADFPLHDTYTDCAGQQRQFTISFTRIPLGFSVEAQEEDVEGEGYYFHDFDPISPYHSLGRIRRRIRRALSTRHIEERHPGVFQATHETLRARISYSAERDEVAFVIDGKLLTLSQFGKLLEAFEGWQFRLDIFDSSDDVA